MKTKILFFLSILIFASSSYSQNWKLLDENKTYFYKHIDSLYITNTIKIDSTNNSATDSIFNIHTTIKICDTCTNIPPEAVGGVLYHIHYPEIFGYAPFYSVTNNHHNLDDNIIQQNSQLSDSWIFNSTSGVIATIVDTDEINILGNLDSIKIIELSTFDTIIISKNHGVIRYPDFENVGKYFLLTGYHEGQNSFGEYLPNMWRIYDFNVGDVFYYSNYWDDVDANCPIMRHLQFEILENLSDLNTSAFRIKLLAETIGLCVIGDFYSYSNYIDTFSLSQSNFSIENQFSGSVPHTCNNDYDSTFYRHPFLTNDLINCQFASESDHFVNHSFDIDLGYIKYSKSFVEYSDSLFWQADIWPQHSGTIEFANGIGRINEFLYGFESTHVENQVGFIKDGDTTGIIYGFPDDLGFENLQSENLFIYPNPTNSQITIPANLQMLSIYSITGDLVLQLENPEQQIYVGDLPAGIYFVHGFDLEGNWMETKLVISH